MELPDVPVELAAPGELDAPDELGLPEEPGFAPLPPEIVAAGLGVVSGLGAGVVGWLDVTLFGLSSPVLPQGAVVLATDLVLAVLLAGDDSALLLPAAPPGLALADPELGLLAGEAADDAEPDWLPPADGLADPEELAGADGLDDFVAEPEAAAEGAHDAAADGSALAATVFAVPVPATPPTADGPGLPCPAAVPPAEPDPVFELCPENTDELTWTMACRSGGTAAATPAANNAQAIASAGRTKNSCQFWPERQPPPERPLCRPRPGPRAPGPRVPGSRAPGPRVPGSRAPGPRVRAAGPPGGPAAAAADAGVTG